MRRLIFSRNKAAAAAHPLEAGDLCMALGKGEKEKHLATVVKGKRVIFFDDGSETEVDAVQVVEATPADRRAAKERYEAALSEAKKIATADTEETVDAAIEQVKAAMGGSLGSDGMISYLFSAGDEAKEGQLLCEALIGNFGTLATASPGARWMSSHWREACEEADTDQSGTISNDEAVLLWDRVAQSISETVTKKLDVLGAPPRLYRGDLCLALPIATDVDERAPDRRYLATYVDSTHVSYFDGLGEVLEVRSIEPVTPAARENAILRYSKAVSQCKMAARRPSDEVVKAAIAKVKSGMGGSLGADNAIDYQAAAGDEAREGHLLVQALVDNFGALRNESKAISAIESTWKVTCAQADTDQSGTISFKEAVAIWDRIIIEMTRTFTSKLDKLGVNPVPLVLSRGDLCMAKPKDEGEGGVRGDAGKVYLATYVDESHVVFFDDGDEAPVEVSRVGPATTADRDVAIVKYTQALNQCMRLAASDLDEMVAESIEEVRAELGGFGADGKINYRADAGSEAREGELLCEALIANLGALWDESRSLRFMTEQWQEVCREADADSSGTIDAAEAALIWQKALGIYTKMVAEKLEQLGVASKIKRKPAPPAAAPAGGEVVQAV